MNTNKSMSKSISDIIYDYTNLTSINNLYSTGCTTNINYIDKDYVDKQSEKEIIMKILEKNPELMDVILVEMRNKKIKKLKK